MPTPWPGARFERLALNGAGPAPAPKGVVCVKEADVSKKQRNGVAHARTHMRARTGSRVPWGWSSMILVYGLAGFAFTLLPLLVRMPSIPMSGSGILEHSQVSQVGMLESLLAHLLTLFNPQAITLRR